VSPPTAPGARPDALALPLPTGRPACADDEASLCQYVWEATENGWLARSSEWLIVTPLTILVILVLAFVARWLLHRLISRATRVAEGDPPVLLRPLRERAPESLLQAATALSERRRQRAATLGSVLRSITSAVVFTVAVMTILGEIGINLGPLLASAGIAGIALGFGAQNIVRDFLSGMFMLLEDQYGVGDIVDLGEAGGVVEAVGLRTTTVRDVNGVVWYIRNGEILRVGNRSQGWAVVVVDVPVPFGTSVEQAQEVLRAAADGLAADEGYADALLEPPEVLGVEQLTAVGMVLRVTVKVTTEGQFRVGREMRRRLGAALDEAGISSSLAGSQVYVRAPAGPGAPGAPGAAGAPPA